MSIPRASREGSTGAQHAFISRLSRRWILPGDTTAGGSDESRVLVRARRSAARNSPVCCDRADARGTHVHCRLEPRGSAGDRSARTQRRLGAENYGNKFPGEAAVYMGIVHAAMYDAALAIQGGYQPYAIRLPARQDASPAAAISTTAHHVLVDLQPALGLTAEQQAGLDARYTAYLAALPDGSAKTDGVAVGEQVAAAYRTLRARDGRDDNPQLGQPPLVPPPAGPGVWDQGAAPAVGLRMPGIRPLALPNASHFRPGGPTPLESDAYAADLQQVTDLGAAASVSRTEEQTCHRAVLDRPRPSSME